MSDISINAATKKTNCIANVLPCHIDHNEPLKAVKELWNPTSSDDGTKKAYFRGRKLVGRELKVPEGYKVAGEKWTTNSSFDTMVIWGHEQLPDTEKNKFVRGIEEWPAFSEIAGRDSNNALLHVVDAKVEVGSNSHSFSK